MVTCAAKANIHMLRTFYSVVCSINGQITTSYPSLQTAIINNCKKLEYYEAKNIFHHRPL